MDRHAEVRLVISPRRTDMAVGRPWAMDNGQWAKGNRRGPCLARHSPLATRHSSLGQAGDGVPCRPELVWPSRRVRRRMRQAQRLQRHVALTPRHVLRPDRHAAFCTRHVAFCTRHVASRHRRVSRPERHVSERIVHVSRRTRHVSRGIGRGVLALHPRFLTRQRGWRGRAGLSRRRGRDVFGFLGRASGGTGASRHRGTGALGH
jgi:hypothetical protein